MARALGDVRRLLLGCYHEKHQIIDGAWNATFSIFQATDEEFAELFPGVDQDMDVVEDVFDRLGEDRAKALLTQRSYGMLKLH